MVTQHMHALTMVTCMKCAISLPIIDKLSPTIPLFLHGEEICYDTLVITFLLSTLESDTMLTLMWNVSCH